MTVWLPVVRYEGYYEVGDDGRVRSIDRTIVDAKGVTQRFRGHELRPARCRGSLMVTLARGGASRSRRVHTLVMEAFVGPCPAGLETCHWNGDFTDNRLANLRYATHRDNMLDRVRIGEHHGANKTHCPRNHAYDEANTRMYRGRRFCRTCKRTERSRARQKEGTPA